MSSLLQVASKTANEARPLLQKPPREVGRLAALAAACIPAVYAITQVLPLDCRRGLPDRPLAPLFT